MSFLKHSQKYLSSPKIIFLILTVLASILYIWPELNFQDILAQGDHGRDLYAFEAVFKNQLPYKDFWWVYGPIMPYYYGLFYKILGFHITSILLGRAFLLVACAAFFYLASSVIIPTSLAFLASIWFIQTRQEFICTYNHIGGTLMSLVMIYALFSYVFYGYLRYLWISLLAVFFLMLIKINFGFVSLFGILLVLPIIDGVKHYPWNNDKWKIYLTAIILIPLITFGVYFLLLKDLPSYVIRQCMPYFGDDQPYHSSPAQALHAYLQGHWHTLFSTPQNMCIGFLLLISTLITFFLLLAGKTPKENAKNLGLTLSITAIFFVLYFHEYLMSNVFYRSFWSFPFLILFQFIMLSTAFKIFHPIVKVIILIFLWEIMLMSGMAHMHKIQSQKTPEHYLSMPRGQIYVGNEPQWVATVNTATEYLNTNLSKDELFFALPYDCLYYYLTGKPSPTRQLIFFDHIKIPPEQEISVIKELETHHVHYVLMSTRIVSLEMDLGFFGKTYCPLLAKYLSDNFTQVYQQGGDMQRNPGWADNHGIFILKKN